MTTKTYLSFLVALSGAGIVLAGKTPLEVGDWNLGVLLGLGVGVILYLGVRVLMGVIPRRFAVGTSHASFA